MKSDKNILKKFFAGFQRITETEISDENENGCLYCECFLKFDSRGSLLSQLPHLVMGLSWPMDKPRTGPAFCKSPSKPKPKDHCLLAYEGKATKRSALELHSVFRITPSKQMLSFDRSEMWVETKSLPRHLSPKARLKLRYNLQHRLPLHGPNRVPGRGAAWLISYTRTASTSYD
jgi:hypothetical protein